MADTKTSAEAAAAALDGTELLPGVQAGGNVKITAQQIADFALALVRNGVAAAFDTLAEIATDLGTRALKATTLTAGAGLTGGGDLSANRTFDIGAGTGMIVNANDIAVDASTAANVLAGTANKVNTADAILGALAGVALTPGATPAVDLATGVFFTLAMGGNYTLANPTNHKVGRTIYVQTTQDGTGTRTLSYDTQYDFGQDTPPALSTAAGTVDLLAFFVRSATKIVYLGIRKDV